MLILKPIRRKSFVGRRTKGGVEALRNDSGVSVTSTREN